MESNFIVEFDSDEEEQNKTGANLSSSREKQTFPSVPRNSQSLKIADLQVKQSNKRKFQASKIQRNNFFENTSNEVSYDSNATIEQPKQEIVSPKKQLSPTRSPIRRKKKSLALELEPIQRGQLKKVSELNSKIQETPTELSSREEIPTISRYMSQIQGKNKKEKLFMQFKDDSSQNSSTEGQLKDDRFQQKEEFKNTFSFKKKERPKLTFFDNSGPNQKFEEVKVDLVSQDPVSKAETDEMSGNQSELQGSNHLSSQHPQIGKTDLGPETNPKEMCERLKKFVRLPIQGDSVFNLTIRRDKSFLNYFSPEFYVEFKDDRHFVMASKKTSSKPTSTFVFSCSKTNFEENSASYLGKMKSNLTGSVLNIFGPGLNPEMSEAIGKVPRELLATVVYSIELFGSGKPREFKVYLKKPEFKYYADFPEVTMYKDEIPLSELIENPFNSHKIDVHQTRKPIWRADTNENVMNFEGKVKMSSVKNFILEPVNNQGSNSVLFGKVTEDIFHLDVHAPFSPVVGLAVALSCFDSRIGSE